MDVATPENPPSSSERGDRPLKSNNPALAPSTVPSMEHPRFFDAGREAESGWVSTSIQDFLNLLPQGKDSRPEVDYLLFEEAAAAHNETDMCTSLVDALKPFAPNLELEVSANDHQGSFGAPGINIYEPDAIQEGQSATKLNEMDGWFKVKVITVPSPHGVGPEHHNRLLYSHLATYATDTLNMQFRTHLFTVWLHTTSCVLFRWDRSKVLFSESFDYRTQPHLVEFIWRFNHATPAERGRDPSAEKVVAPSNEHSSARKALQSLFAGEIPLHAVLTKLRVQSEGSGMPQYFIVHSKVALPKATAAHCLASRVFLAYDCQTQRLVLLKDTWRSKEFVREDETYARLHEHGVPNIPVIVAAGDVGDAESNHIVTIYGRSYVHYRIVLETVGRRLMSFQSIFELVRAFRDTFLAHQKAHEAGVLHRDISFGNILITETRGLLIDWENAKHLYKSESASPNGPAGTYASMSSRLLLNHTDLHHVHNAGDDIESFFHVVVATVIRHGPNQLSPSMRRDWLDLYNATGGMLKSHYLTHGSNFISGLNITYQPLAQLLQDLVAVFHSRYPCTSSPFPVQIHERHDTILALLECWLKDHADSPDNIRAVWNPSAEPRAATARPISERAAPVLALLEHKKMYIQYPVCPETSRKMGRPAANPNGPGRLLIPVRESLPTYHPQPQGLSPFATYPQQVGHPHFREPPPPNNGISHRAPLLPPALHREQGVPLGSPSTTLAPYGPNASGAVEIQGQEGKRRQPLDEDCSKPSKKVCTDTTRTNMEE